MFTKEQASSVEILQSSLNSIIDPNWKSDGNDYQLAACVELIEFIEHWGWKWWKKQEPNVDAAKMELVDILHFITSDAATKAYMYKFTSSYPYSGLTPVGLSKKLLRELLTSGNDVVYYYQQLVMSVGMTGDEVFKLYTDKNVLNIFRQSHGYKDGTYIKMWNGKEDNDVLMELSSGLDVKDQSYSTKLYDMLLSEYKKIKG